MGIEIKELIEAEGWEIINHKGEERVVVNGVMYPVAHPFAIYSKIYREEESPELKYQAFKRMHDILWPHLEDTWNFWDERRFRAHCEGYTYVTYAGGASTGKSHCAARIALLFWLADPAHRTVIVASTTLESLNSRIFGYVIRLLSEMQIKIPYTHLSGMPPKILYNRKDKIHGIYALAAKAGDDDKAIRDIIGRHPERGMLIVLDEATDMPTSLLKALPNLESGAIFFQVMAIGNSLSRFDLHGSLSTPKAGWKSIDPMKHTQWETTQKNGICLFFSCYESPAILETDERRRENLSRFFVTKEQIDSKIKLYGAESDSFWRFVLGFWRSDGADDVVLSKVFLSEFHVDRLAEWSGLYPLTVVAGLDVAFSTGGDDVVLRCAILGQDVTGKIVLDFRKEELLFHIKISATLGKSIELQIAERTLEILRSLNCPLSNLAVDATGQGRAIGEVIRLKAGVAEMPIKIYSVKFGSSGTSASKSFDVIVKSTLELWESLRDFIQTDQLRGLDNETISQLTSRLITVQKGLGKRTLESKAAYKARMGSISPSLAHSPDRADAASLALQAAIIKYGFTPGQRRDITVANTFEMEKMQALLMARAEEQKHSAKAAFAPPIATFESDIYSLIDSEESFK